MLKKCQFLVSSHMTGTIVELSEARFDFLAGLQIYLESRLERPVELIRKRKGLSERFMRRIEGDIQYV